MSPTHTSLRSMLAASFAVLALSGLTAIAFQPGTAEASSKSTRAAEVRTLRTSGQILAIEDILSRSRSLQPGEVVEVELDRDDGRYVYEVKIIDEQDRLHKLYLDAANGELLRRKEK